MTTQIRLFSLNTHLFGRHWFTPVWNDTERAADIGDWLRENQPDIVALQEVWDEHLFDDHINTKAEYLASGYGGDKDFIGLNSGLALLSMHEGHDFVQEEFFDETGIDAFATKGWIRATLTKRSTNGHVFKITVFNTHTQSGDAVEERQSQIEQLGKAVEQFRRGNPDHVVFVVGDLNVLKHSDEFEEVLVPVLGNRYLEPSGETYSNDNRLKIFFGADNDAGVVDYIFFYDSFDGKVCVKPKKSSIVKIKGNFKSGKGISTREVSDHWGIDGIFQVDLCS